MMKFPSPKILLLAACAGCLAFPVMASPLADAEAALSAGDYEKAARDFQTALSASPPSAALYYNLGMALKKSGDAGGAALNFRRALLLAPRMTDARMALSDLDRSQGIPLAATSWRSRIAERAPLAVLLHPGSLLFWLGAFGFLAAAFKARKWGLWVGGLCAILGALLFAAGSLADPRLTWKDGAVVVNPEGAALLAAPAERSEVLAKLPAGSPLLSTKTRGEWAWASLENGTSGWLPAAAIAPLVPGK